MFYSIVTSELLPPGWTKLPIRVVGGGPIDAEMLAGSVGIKCFSEIGDDNSDAILDAVKPERGWWIMEKDPQLAAIEKEYRRVQNDHDKRIEEMEKRAMERRERAQKQASRKEHRHRLIRKWLCLSGHES
jgi:hypothetical protein